MSCRDFSRSGGFTVYLRAKFSPEEMAFSIERAIKKFLQN